MKTIIILFVCASIACFFIETKADCQARDMSKTIVRTGTQVQEGCAILICDDQGAWSSTGCAEKKCKEQIGYKEEDDQRFPDCCPGPICKEP